MGRAVEYRHGFVSEDSGSRFHVSGADTVVQNGHYTENGYSQSSVEYTGSTIDLSGSIKEDIHYNIWDNTGTMASHRFLQRTSATSQESGASQSGSDDVPKRGFGGVLLRGKKPKKGRTDAAEKEVAKSGSERASKGRRNWFGGKTAERSGPSSSSPSASSPSKLSDSSDALATDVAEVGVAGSPWLNARGGEHISRRLPVNVASVRTDQAPEMVSSPPVASSGCLGMFKRAKSEEVVSRGLSQPLLATDGKADKKAGEKLLPKSSRRSTEAAAMANGSHASSSSAVSSRRSSFEDLQVPATDSDTQAPPTSTFVSRMFPFGTPFAAVPSKPAAAPDMDTSAAGSGVEGTSVVPAEDGGRTAQSTDGGPTKGADAEKKGHRRGHSLGSYFPSWSAKRTASVPNLEQTGDSDREGETDPPSPKTPRTQNGDAQTTGVSADAPAAPPKTPELSRNQSALACFGLGGKVAVGEDDGEEVENSKGSKGADSEAMPAGTVGLRNIGNTCFINSALQVLCRTPGFPEILVPDLLKQAGTAPPSCTGNANATTKATGPATNDRASTQPASLLPPVAPVSTAADSPDAAGSSLNSISPAEEAPASSVAAEEPLVSDALLDASAAPVQLPTIRENSPAVDVECLAPVRTKPVIEEHVAEEWAKQAQASEQQKEDDPASPSAQPEKAAAPNGESPQEQKEMQAAEDAAKLQESPLGPDTPAHSEVPFPTTSVASSLSSLWGRNSVHSNASTGSAQTADEAGSNNGAAAAEAQQTSACQAAPGAQPVMCACGLHTVGPNVPQNGPPNADGPPPESKPKPVERKVEPLARGEMAEAFRQLTKEVYSGRAGGSVDPTYLVKKLYQLPTGADFQDGGQHDCQEALRSILLGLHDDLNRVVKPEPSLQPKQELQAAEQIDCASGKAEDDADVAVASEENAIGQEVNKEGQGDENDAEEGEESESAKADREWARHLAMDNSVIYDVFSGQLQSSIKCHKCNKRFTKYEVFLDLSLPLTKEGKSGVLNFFSKNSTPSIEDCLQAFTADEVMQGDEAFQCEHCNERTTATKHFRIHRLPKVLLLHIKRFKYTGTTREKITTNVTFPLKNLSLQQFVSEESGLEEAATSKYELFAVSNHHGSITNGHYMAVCKAPSPPGTKDKDQWYCYSDDSVKKLAASAVPSPNAYLLCYYRKDAEGK